MTANKLTLYLDMDGVLVDFESALSQLAKDKYVNYAGQYDNVPGIFALMEPMPGAIEAVEKLRRKYTTFIFCRRRRGKIRRRWATSWRG